MVWFFSKKKVADTKKEIQVLDKEQIKVIVDEVKYANSALSRISNVTLYSFEEFVKHLEYYKKINTSYEKKSGFIKCISDTSQDLLNMKIFSKKHKKLAERLESDLLDIRGAEKNNKAEYLSKNETDILEFGKNIDEHIDILVKQLDDLSNLDNYQKILDGDKQMVETLEAAFNNVKLGIPGLIAMLQDLLELEKKVEEFTQAYVNA
jgi:hypothetical protein